jgi:hypothetical protein
MRSSSDLVLATLVAKKKPELVMRLGAGDLGGEKHALDIRLSAATLVSKSMRSSSDLELTTLVAKRMHLLSRLSAGDPGGEHKQLDAYNAHVL